jgi:hypothetical protein
MTTATLIQVTGIGDDQFDPVPLSVGARGRYAPDQLGGALRGWATSPPLRALADASGWSWPTGASTLEVLSQLVQLSADWDFRRNRERNFIERVPAEVRGRQISEAQMLSAARALGLVESAAAIGGDFSHLVVLSGQARACVNWTQYAVDLLRGGLRASKVAVTFCPLTRRRTSSAIPACSASAPRISRCAPRTTREVRRFEEAVSGKPRAWNSWPRTPRPGSAAGGDALAAQRRSSRCKQSNCSPGLYHDLGLTTLRLSGVSLALGDRALQRHIGEQR